MHMQGEQQIAAPRRRVWDALNDPAVLGQCIPGCQSLERDGDDRFAAVAEVKIGPIGARFKGAVALSELDPPNGYVITGQGNGGIAGSARGRATVRLSDHAGGTLVTYVVEADVGGRMAQLGGPIIDATARQMAGKFFAKFGDVVSGQAAAAAPFPAADTAPAPLPAQAQAPAPAGGFPWPWIVALALAIITGFLIGRSNAAEVWVVAALLLALATMAAGYQAGRRGGGGR